MTGKAASGGNTSGTREIPVSANRQAAESLTHEEAAALCAEGEKIEKHYGCPMDIEWAIAGGKVYILQARAITTLKAYGSPSDVLKGISGSVGEAVGKVCVIRGPEEFFL